MVNELVVPIAIEDLVNEVFSEISEGKEYVIKGWELDRVYVEMGNDTYVIRMWNISEYEIRWTLFIDVLDEDGGSHGEPLKEGISDYSTDDEVRESIFDISEWEEEMNESKFVSLVLNFLKDEIIECDDASEDGGVHVELRNCNYYVNGRKWKVELEKLLKENGYGFYFTGANSHWTNIYKDKNLVPSV